jgi:hypothetical protein
MACIFMPLPQDSVMDVTSEAATPSGPPICKQNHKPELVMIASQEG